MCLIIFGDADYTIPDTHLRNGWDNNPDGGGLMWIDGDEVMIARHMKLKPLLADYKQVRTQHPDSPVVVHFRMATHGSKCLDNTHPFRIDDDLAVCHNGMIDVTIPKGDDRSDTRVFVDEYLKGLPTGWLDMPGVVKLVEGMIGYSKLVFLTSNPELDWQVYVLNSWMGDWVYEGEDEMKRAVAWYSNKGHEKRVAYPMYGTWGKAAKGWTDDEWGEGAKVKAPVALEMEAEGLEVGECPACGDKLSSEFGICWECYTCLDCEMDVDECECSGYEVIERRSAHAMTDAEWVKAGGWQL